MTPANHKQGQGCPKCGNENRKRGWRYSDWNNNARRSSNFDSFKVYFIKCFDLETKEEFIKIGKTYTTLSKRFNKGTMPYEYTILKEVVFKNSKECSEYEQKLHNQFKEFKYKPFKSFSGKNECFKIKDSFDNILSNLP